MVLETELERLGVVHRHSRPYHPQTCGKVERFHQTLKKHLARQPAAKSLVDLQAQLDRFVACYNEARPHRSLGRRTPREAFDSRLKARPSSPGVVSNLRVRHDVVDKTGAVTLRHEARLHHIGIGARHRGRRVVMLVAHLDVRVLDEDGELLRHLTLDPTRDSQRQDSG